MPYALPGETALIEGDCSRACLAGIETPSPDRVAPFCPYFGRCGGCLTQHMAGPLYAGWKRAILIDALGQAALDAPVEALVDAHGAGRRRITLHARFDGGTPRVGYMAVRSHELVEIAFCPIAEPALREAPPTALALAEPLAAARKPLDIQLTATETGLDVDIRGHGALGERERQALIDVAGRHDLARLSVHGDVLVERRGPILRIGKAQLSPAPGGFLQATRAGEEALASLVIEACHRAKRVADLFAGCGPFALRLAESAEVQAVDGDGRSLAALDKAARGTPGLRRVTTEARDLFRRPLLSSELERFDALVVDPPARRGGVAGKAARRSKNPGRRQRLLRCRHLRARRRDPRRRRLPPRAGDAGGPVQAQPASRDRRRLPPRPPPSAAPVRPAILP